MLIAARSLLLKITINGKITTLKSTQMGSALTQATLQHRLRAREIRLLSLSRR